MLLKNIADFNKVNYEKVRKDTLAFLPNKCINAHVHTATRTDDKEKLSKGILNKFILQKPIDDKQEIFNKVYPGKEMLRIGIPLPLIKVGIEPSVCNEMMLERIKITGNPGLVLPNNLETILEKANEMKVKIRGVKFHPWQFNQEKRNNFKIKEYFNENLLELCEKNKLTLLSELYSGWTEEDKKTLKEISENYRIKIVVPHIGLNYVGFKNTFEEYKTLSQNFERFEKELNGLNEIDNLFVDTSMIIYESMLEAAFKEFGEDKILWGDDYPFGFSQKIIEVRYDNEKLGKGLFDIINGKFKNVNEWKYFFNEYQQLAELKIVLDKLGMNNEKVKKKLFLKNAQKVYNINNF